MEGKCFNPRPGNQRAIGALLTFFCFSLIFLLLFPSTLPAAQVTLAWDPNTETDLAGYKIYIGYASRAYSWSIDAGKVTQATVSNLEDGNTYYMALTAYNTGGLESGLSNEVTYAAPAASQATLTVNRTGTGTGTVTATGINCGSDCSEAYSTGSSVTLTVAADASSTFGGWGGACSGTANTCTVILSANRSVTATFTLKTYAITSSTGGNGTISPSGSVFVNHGASQTYTITPNSGYKVSDVLVDGVSVGAISSYTFSSVTAGHIILASFAANTTPSYTLTVSKSGTGSGTVTNNPAGSSFTSGTTVILTATPDASSTFGGWNGACSGTANTCTVTMSANRSATATFTLRTYTITSSAGANGSITPGGATTVAHGGSQTYTIAAASGYQVESVTVDGSAVGPVSSYTFSGVKGNHSIAATFARVVSNSSNRSLKINKKGSGKGLVTTSPSGTVFPAGTAVTLTAAPEVGSTFVKWSGACKGNKPDCTIVLDASKWVTATFETAVTGYKVFFPVMMR